jgi:rapamycin-insensitive companion of mTOR
MASMDNSPAYSVTPTQSRVLRSQQDTRNSDEVVNPGLQRPTSRSGRSLSGGSTHHGLKGSLQAMSVSNAAPGSFSADLKSTNYPRSGTPRPDLHGLSTSRIQSQDPEDDGPTLSEQRQAVFRDKIAKELKIKLGTENMLEALLAKNAKQTKEQRQKVEVELGTSNRKLAELRHELAEEIQRAQTPITPPSKRMSSYFRSSPLKSPSQTMGSDELEQSPDAFEGESPTLVLTETLQALEIEGMQPDYYIDRANSLVDLFKRHRTLKYDLAWSVFSVRVQMMLLSESTEVVAAGYRLTRYAIADRASLRTIRSLHTDEIVILSLVKKGKAILEREQAVKFVRAFLDVKDGVFELSRGVIRAIVAVAEQNDDRLKNICILTLTELLMRHPSLLVSAGGISTLTEVLAEGSFPASESLVASFLHILDVPQRRRYLKSGHEFEAMFAPFTDPLILDGHEDRLKACIKAISAMLKTWPGLLTLSRQNATALRSLLGSLQYPSPQPKDLILELLFDILRIKPPSWSTTFLAGRRLTTYGRVTNLVIEPSQRRSKFEIDDETHRFDLTSHFSALLLAVLVKAGLIPTICEFILREEDLALKRKATLLLTEVLKLANHSLPGSISSELQVLPDLVTHLHETPLEDRALTASLVYQIESINRTLNRSARPSALSGKQNASGEILVGTQAVDRSKYSSLMDSEQFRQAMADTQIPSHSQYIKWKWDLIHSLVEGPLTNVKRLEEAIKSTKFMKRLVGFYRPFKYRFSLIRNTKPNQRYVRTGCALIHTLTQTAVGIQYLAENKLLPQIAECLAQVDRFSGLTSTSPLFDRHQMAETLSGGYFALLGSLSQSTNGILIMERWHMINMFYHIIDLKDRNDLIRALLGNMDYSLDSHLRVMLSQSLTSGSKEIRLFSTKLLRRYAVDSDGLQLSASRASEPYWPLRMLLTQLYDPDVEVCEVAVKILEEACNRRSCLEYVVKCRPSLDHLGEIGAPLLLRFLSTSIGYHYLHGLDYISQEMDDWFLGRNDTYVTLVEASLARAYIDQASQKGTFNDELEDINGIGLLPPHFYRELARTEEGCRLLRQSGHFYDFASCVRDFKMDEEDTEALTKAKGCLWAIGNVGSMELGSPFLEESEIVGNIVNIAEHAEVISMRGTACFVLGLLSRSTHGYEMLREHGWDTAVNSHGHSLGLCMPNDLDRLCSVSSPLVITAIALTD